MPPALPRPLVPGSSTGCGGTLDIPWIMIALALPQQSCAMPGDDHGPFS